jgi:hypothetical protein
MGETEGFQLPIYSRHGLFRYNSPWPVLYQAIGYVAVILVSGFILITTFAFSMWHWSFSLVILITCVYAMGFACIVPQEDIDRWNDSDRMYKARIQARMEGGDDVRAWEIALDMAKNESV